MIGALVLLMTGLLLSAFFSGSETGLYRVTRIRLALDGLSGDIISRGLNWMVNHPPVFVATSLVGNNLANYLVSYAIVLSAQLIWGGPNAAAELSAPLLAAPFVFIYGELLPKNLYYLAPNRLMRLGGPFFLLAAILFSPVSIALWGLGRVLQRVLGDSPTLVRLQLARRELQQLLEEGRQVGLLGTAQSQLAQEVIECGHDAIGAYAVAVDQWPHVTTDVNVLEALHLARQHRATNLLVWDSQSGGLRGYVTPLGLRQNPEWHQAIRPLRAVRQDAPLVDALMQLQAGQERLARVVDGQGNPVAILSVDALLSRLALRDDAGPRGAPEPNADRTLDGDEGPP